MIRKELKFAFPTAFGALLGIVTGAFLLYLIVGTAFGLVWGYGDHMLHGGHKHPHGSSKKTRRSTKRKSSRKTSRKRRK